MRVQTAYATARVIEPERGNTRAALHCGRAGRIPQPRGCQSRRAALICNLEVANMNDRIEKRIELRVPIARAWRALTRSEEHTSELQSRGHLVCRLLLEKKKI